jgi:hypothetical protein
MTENHDTQRAGQRAFNELYATDPEIANMIRSTNADPFYNDKKLELFRARVAELKKAREAK